MAKRPIQPPAGALPGKSYVVCDITGLLLMANPTLQDIIACRGVYIEYTMNGKANVAMMLGKSFDEYSKVAIALGAVVNGTMTAANYAYQLVKNAIKCEYYYARQPAPSNGRITGGYGSAVAVSAACQVSAVYAVPHGLLAGHWFTHDRPPSCLSLQKTEDQTPISGNNGNYQFKGQTEIELLSPYGPALQIGITNGNSSNNTPSRTNGAAALPTYVAAGKATKTYKEMLDALISTLDLGDANDLKPGLRAQIESRIVAAGHALNQYVVIPIVYGGYADDLRIIGDAISWGCAVAYVPYGSWMSSDSSTVTPFGNTSVAHAGSLAPIGDGRYRLPLCLAGDIYDVSSPIYVAAPYTFAGVAATKWSLATAQLKSHIDDKLTTALLGSQPFGCFFADDRTRKTVVDGGFALAERLRWLWGFSRQTDMVDPTTGYTTGAQTIEQQRQLWVTQVNGADRSSMEISTIGDTYAVTPRKLIAAVNDGVTSDGDDIYVSTPALDRVFSDMTLSRNSTYAR